MDISLKNPKNKTPKDGFILQLNWVQHKTMLNIVYRSQWLNKCVVISWDLINLIKAPSFLLNNLTCTIFASSSSFCLIFSLLRKRYTDFLHFKNGWYSQSHLRVTVWNLGHISLWSFYTMWEISIHMHIRLML